MTLGVLNLWMYLSSHLGQWPTVTTAHNTTDATNASTKSTVTTANTLCTIATSYHLIQLNNFNQSDNHRSHLAPK